MHIIFAAGIHVGWSPILMPIHNIRIFIFPSHILLSPLTISILLDAFSAANTVDECITQAAGEKNGLVLIVTNDYKGSPPDAEGKTLQPLMPCHKDGQAMEDTFKNLFEFACLWKPNCKAEQMTELIKQAAAYNYPPSYKYLVVVFSGHGKEGKLIAFDAKKVDVMTEVVEPLQPCKMTKKKIRRLFFIDACRLGELAEEPAAKGKHEEKGNYYLAFSTYKGTEAFTNPDGDGSRWMKTLAERLRDRKDSVQNIVSELSIEPVVKIRQSPIAIDCAIGEIRLDVLNGKLMVIL